MWVNFVFEASEGTWSEKYAQPLLEGMRHQGVHALPIFLDFEHRSGEELTNILLQAPACDWWFVQSLANHTLPEVLEVAKARDEKVAAHYHGGRETNSYMVYQQWPGDYEGQDKLAEACDLVMFNTNTSLRLFREKQGYSQPGVVAGFPLAQPVQAEEGQRRGIVVGGRVSHDKQVVLTAQILAPWKSDTKFLTGGTHPEEEEVTKVLREWGYPVLEMPNDEYRQALRKASVFFTASYMDTLNVSLCEAVLEGALPAAPALPVFKEYLPVDCLYEPFSVSGARETVARLLLRSDASRAHLLGKVVASVSEITNPLHVTRRLHYWLKKGMP